jgi:multidrug efflux system outer membrane protein
MVQTKLTAAQNIVTLYQSIGGDSLLQTTPVCQPLPGDAIKAGAASAPECRP